MVRNDHATVDELLVRGYDRVVVSPGPVHADRGRHLARGGAAASPCAGCPTLGVCLGHQALVQAWGGKVIRHEPVHGKTTTIEHDGRTIFRGLPGRSRWGATTRSLPIRRCPTCSSAARSAAAS